MARKALYIARTTIRHVPYAVLRPARRVHFSRYARPRLLTLVDRFSIRTFRVEESVMRFVRDPKTNVFCTHLNVLWIYRKLKKRYGASVYTDVSVVFSNRCERFD